jgi:hypothetical protein
MEYEKRLQMMGDGSVGLLIPADLLRWMGLQIGDTVILCDESGKKGKYASFWKKVEAPENVPNQPAQATPAASV